MSNIPNALPAHQPSPRPAPRFFLGCAFVLSFLLNLAAGLTCIVLCGLAFRNVATDSASLIEKTHSGPSNAQHKVAVVEIDGVILENLLGHVHKQIDQAARDEAVAAIVLRIDSPGGSLTASDDLHRRIVKLRDGDADKDFPPKPIVVSMGGVAASGGYYISVPAHKIFAETTTTTGSIGVYSSYPNIAELAAKYGVAMNTIKAGEIKDSGSLFRRMTPKEQQVMQDAVDAAYVQFLEIVETGRKKLTRKTLLERFTVTPLRPDPAATPLAAPYTRYRADGGGFTSAKAKELGLIDALGTLDDAIKAAAAEAQLGEYRAIRYQKPFSLPGLLGIRSSNRPASLLDADRLQAAVAPNMVSRSWV